MNYTIDLHTHSILSHDGGLSEKDYIHLVKSKKLHYIAITDHNDISFAQHMQKQLGNSIIIGEEILTQEGEVIGLYLQKKILPGMSVRTTIKEIHNQQGIVYIPHPGEKLRKGIQLQTLISIQNSIDIIEIFNARSMEKNNNTDIASFAHASHIACAASSDAHCLQGTPSGFTTVASPVTQKNLTQLLSSGTLTKRYAPVLSFLCPFINKIKHTFSRL